MTAGNEVRKHDNNDPIVLVVETTSSALIFLHSSTTLLLSKIVCQIMHIRCMELSSSVDMAEGISSTIPSG